MEDYALVLEFERLYDSPRNRLFAREAGLSITTVAWEDASRNKNSSIGANISDITLNTGDRNMPMIRKPNFSDVTGDLEMSSLAVTVGNEVESGKDNEEDEKEKDVYRRIPLKEYLDNLDIYAGAKVEAKSVTLPRDEVVLCSAQSCILPLKKSGEVSFVPQIHNYQSRRDDSAVLAIVATAQGTSAHIVTERQQKLYFNRKGQATKFLAKRLSQDRAERNVDINGEMTTQEKDRNLLVIYQVPLKQLDPKPAVFTLTKIKTSSPVHQHRSRGSFGSSRGARSFGMEHAMLRSSDSSEGAFQPLGVCFERDPRYPIRATFQFYRVTDTSEMFKEVFSDISKKLELVYDMAKDKGSLVIDHTTRATETGPILLPVIPPLNFDTNPLFAGFAETQPIVTVPDVKMPQVEIPDVKIPDSLEDDIVMVERET